MPQATGGSATATVRPTAFAPLYTASSWGTLVAQAATDATRRNGTVDALGRKIPRLTNRDALALTIAWRDAAASQRAFALWYTYALAALGWERDGDALLVDDDQAAKEFPRDYLASLWLAVHLAAQALDGAKRDDPAIATDDVWGDPDVTADVQTALTEDGGIGAQVKQPLPVCRDRKTGKLRLPRLVKQPDGTYRDPDCEVLTVDDPITAIVKAIGQLLGRAAKPLAVAGGIYVGLTLLDRRRAAARSRKGRRHGSQALRRRAGRA